MRRTGHRAGVAVTLGDKIKLVCTLFGPFLGMALGLSLSMSLSEGAPARCGFIRLFNAMLWPARSVLYRLSWRCVHARRQIPGQYLGYKWALLDVNTLTGEPSFMPMRSGHARYGVDDRAKWYERDTPARVQSGNKVGFYALKRPGWLGKVPASDKRWPLVRNRSVVLLEVDLYGTVVPGTYGYRAERQRVLRVSFERRCAQCRGYRRRAATLVRHNACISPACTRHVGRHPEFPPARLRDLLGTEVGWI